MKDKYSIILLIFLCLIINLNAQSIEKESDNKTVKFSINLFYGRLSTGLSLNTKNILIIDNTPLDLNIKYDKKYLKNILLDLADESKDWYSNVLLYHLTRKDATLVYALTMEDFNEKGLFEYDEAIVSFWRESYKQKEIISWTEYIDKLP
jgi:hypothetical protein